MKLARKEEKTICVVTSIEAEKVSILLAMGATLFGQVRLGWEEVFEAVLPQHWIHPQLTTIAGTECPK